MAFKVHRKNDRDRWSNSYRERRTEANMLRTARACCKAWNNYLNENGFTGGRFNVMRRAAKHAYYFGESGGSIAHPDCAEDTGFNPTFWAIMEFKYWERGYDSGFYYRFLIRRIHSDKKGSYRAREDGTFNAQGIYDRGIEIIRGIYREGVERKKKAAEEEDEIRKQFELIRSKTPEHMQVIPDLWGDDERAYYTVNPKLMKEWLGRQALYYNYHGNLDIYWGRLKLTEEEMLSVLDFIALLRQTNKKENT
jgi:hypothetical protein